MKTVYTRPGTMDDLIVHEMEADPYHIKGLLRAGDYVLDVGANIGAFALFVQEVCPAARIICLEPIPDNFEVLQKNVTGAILEQIALVGKAGPTTMYHFGPQASACHSIYSLNIKDAKPVEVRGETLQQVMDRHGINHLRLLKLDCQGAEFDIITNTSTDLLCCIDYIATEVHKEISKHNATLGVVPGWQGKKQRMVEHLRKTHRPVRGDIERDSVQLWGNLKLLPVCDVSVEDMSS